MLKKIQNKQETFFSGTLSRMLIPALIGILLLADPFFIDVQISRPKLLVIELATFTIVLTYILMFLSTGKIIFNKSSINLPIFVYIAYISILYAISDNKAVAASEFKRMLLCSAIFFTAANAAAPAAEGAVQRTIILAGFIIGSSSAAIYGLMQHGGEFLIFVVPKMNRVFSTFGNPIFFAAHLVIFLPVLMGFIFYVKSKLLKVIMLLLFVLGLAALYFTYTRAAWIGFILSVIVFGIANIKSRRTRIFFLGSLAAVTVGFLIITWNVWLRHQAHPLIWRDTMRMWKDYPVFGTGIGTFHINFPRYASEELLKIWPQKERIINDAHNEYVQLLSETGAIGFGIFLWIIYAFYAFGIKRISLLEKNRDKMNLPVAAGFISAGTAILAQNFFSVDMRFIVSAFYLFLVIGLLFSFNEERIAIDLKIRGATRVLALVIILGVSGLAGISKTASKSLEFHFLQVVHFNTASAKLDFGPSGEGTGILPLILKPYVAQKHFSEEVGFFDEQVLEPYKTIAELEILAKKYKDQQLIFEKLAWVYSKEKNFLKAIENYEKAIKINPNSFGSYNNLGNISFLLGQRNKAIEYYRKSLSIKSDQLDAHTNLGIAFYYEGRLLESAAEFNSVLKLDPNNEKAIVMLKKMRE